MASYRVHIYCYEQCYDHVPWAAAIGQLLTNQDEERFGCQPIRLSYALQMLIA